MKPIKKKEGKKFGEASQKVKITTSKQKHQSTVNE